MFVYISEIKKKMKTLFLIKNNIQCKKIHFFLSFLIRHNNYFSFYVLNGDYALLVVFVQDNVTVFSVDKLGQSPLFNSWVYVCGH